MHTVVCRILLGGAISVCSLAAQAYEQVDNAFFGIEVGQMELDPDDGENFEFPAGTGRVGYHFTDWLGVEGRAGFTGEDGVGDVDVRIPYFVSALARVGWLPADRGFGVYGLAGVTQAKFEASTDFFGIEVGNDETDDGFSFGGGVELYFDERNGLNVEYMRYLDGELDGVDYELNHIGVGYVRRF
jgi:opacity protein-like surface antigen